jgi:hypothetical protein
MEFHQALRSETTAVVLVALASALALLAAAPRMRASARNALAIAAIALAAHLARDKTTVRYNLGASSQ